MSILEEARRILSSDDRVVAAAVFGSRARGAGRPDSDLDVAILAAEPLETPRWRLQGEVAASLCHLVPSERVDVVFLDEAPALLRHQVFAKGELLFCRDDRRWKDLRVATMREHGDREHYRRILREGLKRDLTDPARWSTAKS